jgi:hypothetical protein
MSLKIIYESIKMEYRFNLNDNNHAREIFRYRPFVRIVAIKDRVNSYTIIRRSDVRTDSVFSHRPTVRELHRSILLTMSSMRNIAINQEMQEQDALSRFIHNTLVNHQPTSVPISDAVLNSLKEVSSESIPNISEDKCSICLDNFEPSQKVIVLECNHISHSACLRRWFSEHNTCPQCRFIPN